MKILLNTINNPIANIMASSYGPRQQRQPPPPGRPPHAAYPERYSRYGGGGGGDVQWIERPPSYPPSYSYYPNSPPRRSNGNVSSHRQQPSKQHQQHSNNSNNNHHHQQQQQLQQGPITSPSEPPRSYAPLGYPVPGLASPIRTEEYQTSDETDLPVYPYRPPQLPDTLLGPTFIETERLKAGEPGESVNLQFRLAHDEGLALALDAAKKATSGNCRRITVSGGRPVDNSLLNFDLEFRPQVVPPEVRDNIENPQTSSSSSAPAVPLHYNETQQQQQQQHPALRVDTTPKPRLLSSTQVGPAAMSPGDPITPGKPTTTADTTRKRKVFPPPIGDRTSRYDYQYNRPHFGDQPSAATATADQGGSDSVEEPSPAPSGESLYSHPPYATTDDGAGAGSQEKRQRSESDTSITNREGQLQQPQQQRFTKKRAPSGASAAAPTPKNTVASITQDAINAGQSGGYKSRLRQHKPNKIDNLPPLPPPSYPPPPSGNNRRAK